MNLEEFKKTDKYDEYIKENPGIGMLKIRAYAAREAVPVSGVKIEVSNEIDGMEVIFYSGVTDESGMTDKINLPVPKLDTNNMNLPNKMVYQFKASYPLNNFRMISSINMYDGICVVQNIVVTMNMEGDIID